MKIAVVGATGLVGGVMLKVLEERNVQIDKLLPVASEASIGKKVVYMGNEYVVVGLQQAVDEKPDIAILDISMPTVTGIEASRYLKKYVPETKVLILSRHDNEEYVKQVLNFGACGYVLKDDAGDDLLRAVKEIMKGNIYLSPKLTTYFINDYFMNNNLTWNFIPEVLCRIKNAFEP